MLDKIQTSLDCNKCEWVVFPPDQSLIQVLLLQLPLQSARAILLIVINLRSINIDMGHKYDTVEVQQCDNPWKTRIQYSVDTLLIDYNIL